MLIDQIVKLIPDAKVKFLKMETTQEIIVFHLKRLRMY